MKRFITAVILSLLLLVPGIGSAADVVQAGNGWDTIAPNRSVVYTTFTVTADGAGNVAEFTFLKPEDIMGYYLLSVEMYSATDDAFVTIIYSGLGTTMFSHTTTAATSGEIKNGVDRWPVYSTWSIDVTGLAAAEVATIVVTFVR